MKTLGRSRRGRNRRKGRPHPSREAARAPNRCVGYYLRMNASNASVASIPEDQVNLIVEVFRMLADPTRIKVLWALTGGELSVNEPPNKWPSLGHRYRSIWPSFGWLGWCAPVGRERRSSTAWKMSTSVSSSWMQCSTLNTPARKCLPTIEATAR
jgi:hypothetical protein